MRLSSWGAVGGIILSLGLVGNAAGQGPLDSVTVHNLLDKATVALMESSSLIQDTKFVQKLPEVGKEWGMAESRELAALLAVVRG